MKPAIMFSILLLPSAMFLNAQTPPSFTLATGSPFAVGTGPVSVTTADFNGDGIIDIAAANGFSDNVSVLLGNGSGGFRTAPGSPFNVGVNPGFVIAGDFNKDGRQDIAVANGNNGNLAVKSTVTVFLGDGQGGFTAAPGPPSVIGTGTLAMALGDFNGDGIADLAVANPLSDTITVLLGNGSGSFSAAPGSPILLLSSAAVSVGVADFNKDGIQDLALGTGRGGIAILLGNGKGGFTPAAGGSFAAGLNAGRLTIADFNADGILDIAAANANGTSNNVTVLLGNGAGGFTIARGSPFAVGTNPAAIVAADFNGDGIKDLATANQGTNDVTLLLGNGSGGFTVVANGFPVGSSPLAVVSADFNGDGTPDLVTANTVSGDVTVLLAKGSGGTTVPVITQGGIVPVYSNVGTIQPGEWVSIYGSNLVSSTATWNGDFPTSLGGTSVTIDGKSAYLWFVSSSQINLQVPDDATTGSVPVVVKTANGNFTSTVTLAAFAPSFSLLDSKHVTGIILRSNGAGAYGGGAYDIIGPTGSTLGYPTVAAKPGDTVELFAVGLGPTSPVVFSGQVFSGAASTTNTVNLRINSANVTPSFAGLSSAGLYQVNFTVPVGLGIGDLSIIATVGGAQTPTGVVISLQ